MNTAQYLDNFISSSKVLYFRVYEGDYIGSYGRRVAALLVDENSKPIEYQSKQFCIVSKNDNLPFRIISKDFIERNGYMEKSFTYWVNEERFLSLLEYEFNGIAEECKEYVAIVRYDVEGVDCEA